MRTGLAYAVAISSGVLLGVFVDNLVWLILIPAVVSALAIISVVNSERQRNEELQMAQSRVRRLLDSQRRYAQGDKDALGTWRNDYDRL